MTGNWAKIDEDEYHRDRDRMGSTALGYVARDPRLLRLWLMGKSPIKVTDDMRLGSYGHALILEGSKAANLRIGTPPNQHHAYKALSKAEKKDVAADKEVVRVMQDPSPAGEFKTMQKLGAENKMKWDEFYKRCGGRYIKHEQIPMATAMARAVMSHPKAGELLAPGNFVPEMSMRWLCPHTNEPLRGRLDALLDSGDTLELKCTHLVNPVADVMAWVRAGWARQDAMYMDGVHAITGRYPDVWKVLVQPTADDPIVVTRRVRPEGHFHIAGRDGFDRVPGYVELIRKAQRCRDTGDFRHDWEIETEAEVTMPDWAMIRMENDEKIDAGVKNARQAGPQYGEVNYG